MTLEQIEALAERLELLDVEAVTSKNNPADDAARALRKLLAVARAAKANGNAPCPGCACSVCAALRALEAPDA